MRKHVAEAEREGNIESRPSLPGGVPKLTPSTVSPAPAAPLAGRARVAATRRRCRSRRTRRSDRQSVVEGKRGAGSVDLRGRRAVINKIQTNLEATHKR